MKKLLKYLGLSMVLCAAVTPRARANEFNHYVTYLEAINAKHDEVQEVLAQSPDTETSARYQEVIWTHVYHLLGLVKETVEFENTNVWVWTGENKYGHIKYIGALPHEANRTFAQEESLRGRYDGITKKITLASVNGLCRAYEMPDVFGSHTSSIRYTRLVTYLTEEVERLLASERAITTALQGSVPEKPKAKPKPNPKPKPKPKPQPPEVVLPAPSRPIPEVVLPAPSRPVSVKPVAPKPKETPVVAVVPEVDLPAYEDDDIESGLFAALTFPGISFGSSVDPATAKKVLLATGAIAGSISVLHFTDKYYFDGMGINRVLNMLACVGRQLGRPLYALRMERLHDALSATATYLANTRVMLGLRGAGNDTKEFMGRVAHAAAQKVGRLGNCFIPPVDIDY